MHVIPRVLLQMRDCYDNDLSNDKVNQVWEKLHGDSEFDVPLANVVTVGIQSYFYTQIPFSPDSKW